MRILLNEMKKILDWRMLSLLVIVNSLLYFLLIDFNIKHFPNGRPELDSYNIGVEMINKYGTDMDEGEFQDFKKTYDAQVEEANGYLQSHKEFVDAGIKSYEDFKNIDMNNEKLVKLRQKVVFEEQVTAFWELQERERLIEFYNSKEQNLDARKKDVSTSEKMRLDELKNAGHFQVYTEVAIENYKFFIFNVAITIILSVVLVISPLFIKDRSRKLLDLQYTTRKGRNLYKTKVAAGLISAFLVITTLLAVYFSFYSLNNTSMFFNLPIYVFIGVPYWYDITFFQYIVLTVIAIYTLGFIFALLSMSFSTRMPNYISLIGIQIPLVVTMTSYGLEYLMTHIISLRMSQWVVPTVYSGMVLISILFVMIMWRKEKKRDILI